MTPPYFNFGDWKAKHAYKNVYMLEYVKTANHAIAIAGTGTWEEITKIPMPKGFRLLKMDTRQMSTGLSETTHDLIFRLTKESINVTEHGETILKEYRWNTGRATLFFDDRFSFEPTTLHIYVNRFTGSAMTISIIPYVEMELI